MKRLVIERVIVYVLFIAFILFSSISNGNKSLDVEQRFVNDIESKMKSYNFVSSDCYNCDLKFTKDQDSVTYKYEVYTEKVKVKNMEAVLNLSYESNLNDYYDFLNGLYTDNVSKYNDEIMKMIDEYRKTGEMQIFQELNSTRELTLEISTPVSLNGYRLRYSIFGLNH